MTGKQDPLAVIEQWAERDLTLAAAAGELPRAFDADGVVHEVRELLTAGRCPILSGEAGIGKTAVVYEVARRLHEGDGPECLMGKRLLQVSLLRQAAPLKRPNELASRMQELIDALGEVGEEFALFIRDLPLASTFGLTSHLGTLAYRLGGRVIGEGHPSALQAMLEYNEELEQYYYVLTLEEPSLERCARILEHWSREQAERFDKHFDADALQQALNVTHRFLARSRMPRKALDLLAQVGTLVGEERRITQADVINRFCTYHRTPRVLLDPALPLDLSALEEQFSSEVLGQPEAVQAVVNMIGMVKAGLSDMRRPFGVFLFVGPTGVGKTHLAQLLAEYLFGSRDRMIRFNMADYPEEGDAVRLFGDPDGAREPQRRGLLTTRMMGHPFAVVLLDELEKAHAKVHDRFLQLVDEGQFINGAGESVSCRSMIVIATSNAGSHIYRGRTFGFGTIDDLERQDRDVDRVLDSHFRAEFLNRFDHVVHFHPLTREDIRTIALRELEHLQRRTGLTQRRLSLDIDESVLDWLTAHGYDPDHGARMLRRTIERSVTTAISDVIVRSNPSAGACICLAVRHNRIVAYLRAAAEPAEVRAPVAVPVGTTEQVRSLDREGLLQEAETLLQNAQSLLDSLRRKREERGRLLESMNVAGFWERQEQRRETLDRFRELDVSVRLEDRFAAPILRLADWLHDEEPASPDLRQSADRFESAALALREWEDRLAEEGGHAIWLVISNADLFDGGGEWIETLAEMEIGWCRRLHCSGSVAAYELNGDEVSRVVLDIEGPGVERYFGCEAGIHRRTRHGNRDQKARVEVIPKGASPSGRWPGLSAARRARTVFRLNPQFHGRIELAHRGMTVELLGAHERLLTHLLFDLSRVWGDCAAEPLSVARVYGVDGGAKDPRTGAVMYRLKDVFRGQLNPFLEGWRQHLRQEVGKMAPPM